MDSIIDEILQTEKECAIRIERAEKKRDDIIARNQELLVKNKEEEISALIKESRARKKAELTEVENRIEEERDAIKAVLEELKRDEDLCRRIRQSIITILFPE